MVNEELLLSRVLQKGLITAAELLEVEGDLENAGGALKNSVFGPRLDSLIKKDRLSPEAVQKILEELELQRIEEESLKKSVTPPSSIHEMPTSEIVRAASVPVDSKAGSSPDKDEPFGELEELSFEDSAADSDFTPTGELSREEIERSARSGNSASNSPTSVSRLVAAHSGKVSSKPSSKLQISRELLNKHLKDAAPMADLPVKEWDRYVFVAFLGEGGMGKVYKAYDPYLQRYVALKFIRGDDSQMARRFIQEAQTQAKVDHRNVCKVYEVGEVQDKLYIAMQFIEGKTLSAAKKDMPLEQKIRVMRDVCEGVHAAHRNGLIHRDIKPANIMVEQTEEGPVPYVMDFGLAKEQNATGMTQSGVIVGTPWYMAPEQAVNDLGLLDRRTDIYSLGASFYETLVGRTPFEGGSGMEVLMKVINEEPARLSAHDPKIPADLETIVMKCLEKDPLRRYHSAREAAEDFQHYLNDEPIIARRASRLYRYTKKAKKHKALVALASVAAVVVIWVFSLLAQSRINAARTAELANRFGQEVKEIEAVMRYAYMLPQHPVDGDALIDSRVRDISADMQVAGKISLGPGNYALGRGEMAKEFYNAALIRLREAWDNHFRSPEVAYALGRSLGETGEIRRTRIMREPNAQNREKRLREINEQFFKPAVLYLDQARASKTEAAEYVEGLRAFYDKDSRCSTRNPELALVKAKLALQKNNWLYEAKKLEGDISRASGDEKSDRGDYEGALKDYETARQAYQETVNMARSDKVGYEGLCNVWNEILMIDVLRGNNPDASFQEAKKSCQDATKVNPKSTKGYDGLSDVYARYATYAFDHGEDATPLLDGAIASARTALKINSTREDIPQTVGDRYLTLATALWLKGLNAANTGEDPSPSLNESMIHFKVAVKKDPANAEAYLNMATAFTTLSEYQMSTGQDPQEALDSAVTYFKKSIELNPGFVESYGNLGKLYWQKAQEEMQNGKDPSPSLKTAEENLIKALKVNPHYANALDDLGITYTVQGIYEMNHGKDPSPSFQKALKSYEDSLKENPDSADTNNNLGEAYRYQGLYLLMTGGEPGAALGEAIAEYNKALMINPGHPDAFANMGSAYTLLVPLQSSPGSAAADLTAAIESIKKAISIDSNFPDYHAHLAKAYVASAKHKLRNQSPPQKDLAAALQAAEKAVEIDPQFADGFLQQGLAEILLAELPGAPREEHLKKADDALGKAKDLNPQDANILVALAKLGALPGRNEAEIQECIATLETVFTSNPNLVEAKAVQGQLFLRQAQGESDPARKMELAQRAAAALNDALARNRHLLPEYKADRDLAVSMTQR